MSRNDPGALYDGFSVINGGMDGGNAPSTIGRGKVSFARNVTFRGGFPDTRPGFCRHPLSFESTLTQSRFETGLFQGASPFEPYNGGHHLVASIGGRLFRINVDAPAPGFKVQDISASTLNPSTRPKAWFVQAEDFLVVQDGQSAPLIHDGITTRRVNPSSVPKEIPTGTVMEYSMGRLWLVLPTGRSFIAGDLVFGDAGTTAYNRRDSVLKFTENTFLNEGGEFGVPADVGLIRSLRTLATLDTSLGQGPLQVMAERGVFSVDAPFDRTTWKNLQRPIQTVSLLGSGSRSHEASVLVNGDIWFRSGDGIRSFQVARRDQGTWVNTPLSSEMTAVIDRDDPALLLHASAALFDNRYLLTCTPSRVASHGIVWSGLIALDFHNVSGISARTAPAYDGLWTGLSILQIVPLGDRCFLFILTGDLRIELWEVSLRDEFDNRSSQTPTRISSYIDTPAFDYADKGWDRKTLTTGDLWYDRLAGTVNFRVQYRPDDQECWNDWHSWSIDSKRETCLDECGFPLSLRPQYRPRMRLPLPQDDCNPTVNMPARHGFKHQLRIAWEGKGRLTRFRATSHEWQEEVDPYCQPSEPTDVTGVACCDTALFSYQSLYWSAVQSVSCAGSLPLTSLAPLPSNLSISGSTLIVASGSFNATTQAAADSTALAYVTNYMTDGIASGSLVCGDVPCFEPGTTRPFLPDFATLPFDCVDCLHNVVPTWDGYLRTIFGNTCHYRSVSPARMLTSLVRVEASLDWDAVNNRWDLLIGCFDTINEENQVMWYGHKVSGPGASPAGTYTLDPAGPGGYQLNCASALPTVVVSMSTPP